MVVPARDHARLGPDEPCPHPLRRHRLGPNHPRRRGPSIRSPGGIRWTIAPSIPHLPEGRSRDALSSGAMAYPRQRPRRMRRTPALRALIRETDLAPRHLIAPLFVKEGVAEPVPISLDAGAAQHTLESLRKEAVEIASGACSPSCSSAYPSARTPRAPRRGTPTGSRSRPSRAARGARRRPRRDRRPVPRRVHRPRALRRARRRGARRQRRDPRALPADRARAGGGRGPHGRRRAA